MLVAWVAAVVCMAAAGRDLGWRIIDHWLVAALLLLWAAHAALSGWGWAAVLAHMGVGFLAFVVTLALYALGGMAGGDVKLAVAVFLWAGPDQGLAIAQVVAAAGIVLAAVGLAARFALRLPMPVWGKRGLGLISTDRGVPYGVALALGGAVAALSAPAGMG